ncbi:MAG: Asp-tRNA(Asn)/Glu-tRNA(Gln) amidotransferase GatCAB subunit C [Archaeoglobales archaeon]|nr:MAG: Asp-tRNA(Asn)/Glu-tRNA(Gln) amidotransferase GatCAB subunit C [Archaeoglobales archaeon]
MISEEDVYKIANLAKIEIKPEEVEKFKNEFQSILEYFNILDEVEEDIEPTFQVLPLNNVFRDDSPRPCVSREEALKNAKHVENGYFKGPKVVE